MGFPTGLLAKLPPPVIYSFSIALEKAVSLITIPLLAAYVAPGAFGRYDVAVSIGEFAAIVAAFGLVETMIRYTSTAKTDEEQRRHAAEFAGAAIVMAVFLGSLFQLAVPWMARELQIPDLTGALRWSLAAATATILVDLPLIWMRMQDRAWLFLTIVVARALAMAAMMWIALSNGYGTYGVLVTNASVYLASAALLIFLQWRDTGIRLSNATFGPTFRYAIPILGAGMAMFALGNMSRWFLPGQVADAEIAYLGVATRLANAMMFLLGPLYLWWDPRRLSMLSSPEGLRYSAGVWGVGYTILTAGAMIVCLIGPVFITVAFPPSYAETSYYIPLMVLAIGLHLLCLLSNAGTYAKESGVGVLLIDSVGAVIALASYYYLVPLYGITGAVGGVIAAQCVRLFLYFLIGRKLAPIPYPIMSALVLTAFAVGSIGLAPEASQIFYRLAWSCGCMLGATALVFGLKLIPFPAEQLAMIMQRFRQVREP